MKHFVLIAVCALIGLCACKKDEYPIRPKNVALANYVFEDRRTGSLEFDEVQVWIYYQDEPYAKVGEATTTHQNFRITLQDPIPEELLVPAELYFQHANQGLELSDAGARLTDFQETMFIPFLDDEEMSGLFQCRGYDLSGRSIYLYYAYSDRDVRITGRAEHPDFEETLDLNLKHGWNRIAQYIEYRPDKAILVTTTRIPLVRIWKYYDD